MPLVLCSLDSVLKDDVPMYGWAHQEKGQLSSYAFKGDVENLKRLVTRKNVDERGLRGYSPLMWACTGGKIAAVKFLLEAGAAVNHTDDVGATPLHVASWYGRQLIVQALIEKGAIINAYTLRDGRRNHHTPLHFACRGLVQAKIVIKQLVASGADLHARNGEGNTPLHLAILNNSEKAKVLLKAGAKVNEPDRYGNSPLHIVDPHKDIRMLIEFGADVDLENYGGKTPLHTLTKPEDITLFLEYGAGARVLCNKWGCGCGKTVLMCCYSASLWCMGTEFMWCEESVESFEKHIIRHKVCGLYLGKDNDPMVKPHEIVSWPAADREEYLCICEAEFAQMSAEIPNLNTTVTYKDVLFQRPFALSARSIKKVLTLEHCQERFPEYGGLIYSRFIIGQRRLSLVNRCLNFFKLANPPLLLSNVIAEVYSYLDDEDLRELGIVCEAAKKRPTRRISSGGSCAQQVSKDSKKDSPRASQQGSKVPKKGRLISQQGSEVATKRGLGTSRQAQVSKKGRLVTTQQGSELFTKRGPGTSQQAQVSKKGRLATTQQDSEVVKKGGPGTSQQDSDAFKKGIPGTSLQAQVSKKCSPETSHLAAKFSKQGSPGTSQQHSKETSPSLHSKSPNSQNALAKRSKRSNGANHPGPSSGNLPASTKRCKREK